MATTITTTPVATARGTVTARRITVAQARLLPRSGRPNRCAQKCRIGRQTALSPAGPETSALLAMQRWPTLAGPPLGTRGVYSWWAPDGPLRALVGQRLGSSPAFRC